MTVYFFFVMILMGTDIWQRSRATNVSRCCQHGVEISIFDCYEWRVRVLVHDEGNNLGIGAIIRPISQGHGPETLSIYFGPSVCFVTIKFGHKGGVLLHACVLYVESS